MLVLHCVLSIVLAILGFLPFPMNFRISLSILKKKKKGLIFIGTTLNLQIKLGRIAFLIY